MTCIVYACGAPLGWLTRCSVSPEVVAISALFHPMKTLPAGGAWFSSSSVKSPFPLVALINDALERSLTLPPLTAQSS